MPAESKLTDPSSWGLSDFFSTYLKRAKNIQLNLSLVKDRWRKCLVEKVGIFLVGYKQFYFVDVSHLYIIGEVAFT